MTKNEAFKNAAEWQALFARNEALRGKAKSARTALDAIPSEGTVKGNAAVQRVIDDLSSMSEDELTWFKMDQSELIGKLLACLAPTLSGEADEVSEGERVPAYDATGSGVKVVVPVMNNVLPRAAVRLRQSGLLKDARLADELDALSTHAAAGAVPVGEATDAIHAYAQEYEFRCDDGGGYTPTEGERAMIEDAINGFLSETARSAVPVGEAILEAAWQAFGDCPVDMCGDHDTEQRKCVDAAVLAALAARPVEEPGEVERLTRERDRWQFNATVHARENKELTDERDAAEAALAETREALRDLLTKPTDPASFQRAVAALTDDAQEVGE